MALFSIRSKHAGTKTQFSSPIFTCRKQATIWGWRWGMWVIRGEGINIYYMPVMCWEPPRTWHSFTLTTPRGYHPPPAVPEKAPAPSQWRLSKGSGSSFHFTPIPSCNPGRPTFSGKWPDKYFRLFESASAGSDSTLPLQHEGSHRSYVNEHARLVSNTVHAQQAGAGVGLWAVSAKPRSIL